LPKENVTEAVGRQHGETVATNVIAWPASEGLTLDTKVVVVAVNVGTNAVVVAEEPANMLLPLYIASII
jgi:predicted aconitase with swiveling domain